MNWNNREVVEVTRSDVEQRLQRSQNNRQNEHNSDKTKKNFTGFYTEVNPKTEYSQLSPCGHIAITDTPIIRTAVKSPATINYTETFD